MNKDIILLVDDEKSIRDVLRMTLEYEGYEVSEADSGPAALAQIKKELPDAIILDVKMSGMDGIETLETIKDAYPDMPVVLLTGHGSIETAVEATKKGAFDFLSKPPDREKILIVLRNAIEQNRLLRENLKMKQEIEGGDHIIGASEVMADLMNTVKKVAPTEVYVLITGDNGTGKELIAKALHRGSSRADSEMIEVNCAAIPHELIESELFGHEKGAFTGATTQRIGKFEQADGGTLFLDEIGDMSLSAQAKVLRILEDGTFERVGGNRKIRVNVRVIAATNKDLALEIREGNFREDLFHRLNVFPIRVPPLSDRKDDIPLLVEYFLQRMCSKNKIPLREIDTRAVAALQERAWTGNVRELRNAVERLTIMVNGSIRAADVRQYAFGSTGEADEQLPMDLNFQDFKDRMEGLYLARQLENCDWNVSRTADVLGIQRSHLYSRMKKFGLTRENTHGV